MRSLLPFLALLSLALILLSLALAGRVAMPAARFTITDLGAVPKAQTQGGVAGAAALNDRGQVVGDFGHAFLWGDGYTNDLGTLPPEDPQEIQASSASAINNRGQVVGTSGSYEPIMMDGMDERGFLYTNKALRYLTRRGENDQFEPGAINDAGEIVGEDRHTRRGFFYANGRLITLGTLSKRPAGNYSEASGISGQGQVVGWSTVPGPEGRDLPAHAFLWQRGGKSGRMRDLGTLPGWADSYACGINDRGEVAGTISNGPDAPEVAWGVQPGFPAQAFLWRVGKMTSLGTLAGCRSSQAFGINNAGAVVGQSGGKAFLWQSGTMLDLNALIPSDLG